MHSWKWVYADDELPFGLPYSYVEGASLSFTNIAPSNQQYVNGGFMALAGPHSVAGPSLTLYEDQHASSLKWINVWKRAIKDFSSGLYNGQSSYKRDLKFNLMDTTGAVVLTAKYMGCFPTDTSPLDLQYTESGRLTISQAFWADDSEIS